MRALLALVVVGLLGLLAVGVFRAFREWPRGREATAAAARREGDRVRVRDASGAEVSLPRGARRVFPANAGVLDYLHPLLEPERIAAIPNQAFRWSVLAARPRGYEQHPRFDRFLAEEVLAHRADLVLCSTWNEGATKERIAALGLPILTLPETPDVASVCEVLRALGVLLAVEERAGTLTAALRERERRLVAKRPARPLRVLGYTNFGTGGFAPGAGTTTDTIIRLAGGINAAAAAGRKGHAAITVEEILELAPDVILVSEREGAVSRARQVLAEADALRVLEVLQRDRILSLPPRLLASNSPTMLDAAEALGTMLRALERSRDEDGR